jgi:hypothetical protein
MQECDTGTNCQCCFGEREGQLAEVFYSEGVGDLGVVLWKADFFEGFAAGYFEGCFVESVSLAAGEGSLAFCLLANAERY